MAKDGAEKNIPDPIPDTFLGIVGRNMMQNNLLLSFLKEKTGIQGICIPTFDSLAQIDPIPSAYTHLFILDYKNIDMKHVWTRISSWKCEKASQCYFMLCNAQLDWEIEKTAVENGIRGICYVNDPIDLIIKAVRYVLKGDLWYSRKTFKKYLMAKRSSQYSSWSPELSSLTYREKQMLSYIASGYSSQAIADELSISIHTVKTHVYNAYRKINATNRREASLWATKYL
jgi:LuxR family transcriptional regulator, positive regulator of biofilm formation